MHVSQFCFLLASAHHLPSVNYSYIFLLLLVVLSGYSESPKYAKPLIEVVVYPDSSLAQWGILATVLPCILPHDEVYKTTQPQNKADKIVLPQNDTWLHKTVLFKIVSFKIDAANCQLFQGMKKIIGFVLNLQVKCFNNLRSVLIDWGEKLGWTMRILLESLQHVLKMYIWSLSENQVSIRFRCRLVRLFLKQSFFRKHDFDILVYRIYHEYQE